MIFEYDDDKSASNLLKHGIDFEEAQTLWEDSDLMESDALVVDDEPRVLSVAMIGQKHWTAITLPRGNSVRIISVRRSRKKEIEAYESGRIR